MDEFLGESGKATIVLLKLEDDEKPPSIRELRRDLEVESIKYYKGNGWYTHAISRLERLLRIREELQGQEVNWMKYNCTDFLQLDSNVRLHPFYLLKHSTKTIAGFDLTIECFEELDGILRSRDEVLSMQGNVEHFQSRISDNIATAAKYSLDDKTLLEPQLAILERLFEKYGEEGVKTINARLEKWHQTHKWKSMASEASDDSEKFIKESEAPANP